MEDQQEDGSRKRYYSQAKNDLKNPSKGKYRRIATIDGPSKNSGSSDDNELLKRYGLKSSQIRLYPLPIGDQNRDGKLRTSLNTKSIPCSSPKKFSGKDVSCQSLASNPGKIVIDLDSITIDVDKPVNEKRHSVDSDSDVEIVEQPVETIVLDDEHESSEHDAVCENDEELLKKYGIQDVSVKLGLISSDQIAIGSSVQGDVTTNKKHHIENHDTPSSKTGIKSFSVKDVRIKLDKIDDEQRLSEVVKFDKNVAKGSGKIDNGQIKKSCQIVTPKSVVSIQKLDTMSSKDWETLLNDDGISVYDGVECSKVVSSGQQSTKGTCKTNLKKCAQKTPTRPSRKPRSPSPQPSTSSGYRGKRKRTARKSVPSQNLALQYSLKEPKIHLKSLSKIEIALLRNPHSPFGKNEWSKHKFDSDNDSDEIEWDLPTSPEVDDYKELVGSTNTKGNFRSRRYSDTLNQEHETVKNKDNKEFKSLKETVDKDAEMLKQFGLTDSKVMLQSVSDPMVSNTLSVPKDFCAATNDGLSTKDLKLLEKFGMSPAKVVVKECKKKDIIETNSKTLHRNRENMTVNEITSQKLQDSGRKSATNCRKKTIVSTKLPKFGKGVSKERCLNEDRIHPDITLVKSHGAKSAQKIYQIREKKSALAKDVEVICIDDIPTKDITIQKETMLKCKSAMEKLRLKSLSRAKEKVKCGRSVSAINSVKLYADASRAIKENDRKSAKKKLKPKATKRSKNSVLRVHKSSSKTHLHELSGVESVEHSKMSKVENEINVKGIENKENEVTNEGLDEVDGGCNQNRTCLESKMDSDSKLVGRKGTKKQCRRNGNSFAVSKVVKLFDRKKSTTENCEKIDDRQQADITTDSSVTNCDHHKVHRCKTTVNPCLGVDLIDNNEASIECSKNEENDTVFTQRRQDMSNVLAEKENEADIDEELGNDLDEESAGNVSLLNNPGIVIIDATSNAVVGDLILNGHECSKQADSEQ